MYAMYNLPDHGNNVLGILVRGSSPNEDPKGVTINLIHDGDLLIALCDISLVDIYGVGPDGICLPAKAVKGAVEISRHHDSLAMTADSSPVWATNSIGQYSHGVCLRPVGAIGFIYTNMLQNDQ
jgi:hypothetical protein